MKRPRRWRWWGKWVGAVLCAAIIVLWLVSRWRMPSIGWGYDATHGAQFANGGNVIFFIERGSNPAGLAGWRVSAHDVNAFLLRKPSWAWDWPSVGPGDVGGLTSFHATLPVWTLFLLIAIPTTWFWFRHRRRIPGLCPRCNYDLSATPTGPCPECGRTPGA